VTASPLVSIGVPVYNGARLLRRTLESLVAQTYTALEIIVLDNASTDETPAIAREFAARDARVRYVRNETNIGAVPNFRKVLGLASGKYFTWTAADDSRPPEAIERCVRALEDRPGAVMAHGPIELELPAGEAAMCVANHADLAGGRPSERVRAFTRDVDHVGLMFGLHRRDVLHSVEYGSHVAGDYFVCLQMSQRGPIAWIPWPMLVYRHQYGAVDNPMYARAPITLRDLLLHRGLRRRKCWMVLGLGCHYLWREGARHGTRERLRTVRVFASTFVRRFRAELATELVYLATSPISWIAAPLVPIGRKLRTLTGTAS
jgi:glycosyltransferase involved in cell wall biosynthesis